MERKFKRGDRVEFTGSLLSYKGKLGTVTGRDQRGWLRVRFDEQKSYEKGVECSDSNLTLSTAKRIGYIAYQTAMVKAVQDLRYEAQMLLNALDAEPELLAADDAAGDEARAARDNAKRWLELIG